MDLLKDSVPLDELDPEPCCSIAVGGYACTCEDKPSYTLRFKSTPVTLAQAPARGDLETLVKQLGGQVIWDARHLRPVDGQWYRDQGGREWLCTKVVWNLDEGIKWRASFTSRDGDSLCSMPSAHWGRYSHSTWEHIQPYQPKPQ
jgi:hypothetical protein